MNQHQAYLPGLNITHSVVRIAQFDVMEEVDAGGNPQEIALDHADQSVRFSQRYEKSSDFQPFLTIQRQANGKIRWTAIAASSVLNRKGETHLPEQNDQPSAIPTAEQREGETPGRPDFDQNRAKGRFSVGQARENSRNPARSRVSGAANTAQATLERVKAMEGDQTPKGSEIMSRETQGEGRIRDFIRATLGRVQREDPSQLNTAEADEKKPTDPLPITLAYLGKDPDVLVGTRKAILSLFASQPPPLVGRIRGIAQFNKDRDEPKPLVALYDCRNGPDFTPVWSNCPRASVSR